MEKKGKAVTIGITKRTKKLGEKLGVKLPLFWNNDGKDRPKGQICPLAKKEVFIIIK